jgi:hypothetical protein
MANRTRYQWGYKDAQNDIRNGNDRRNIQPGQTFALPSGGKWDDYAKAYRQAFADHAETAKATNTL